MEAFNMKCLLLYYFKENIKNGLGKRSVKTGGTKIEKKIEGLIYINYFPESRTKWFKNEKFSKCIFEILTVLQTVFSLTICMQEVDLHQCITRRLWVKP
jgi:hypothetical protein